MRLYICIALDALITRE